MSISVEELDVEKVEPQGDNKWYFVDESIKDRLGDGDGPSFSVASLFSSKGSVQIADPNDPDVKPPTAATGFWKKDSLFILDPKDSRVSGAGQFFNVKLDDADNRDLSGMRQEIQFIIQNKVKRLERNKQKYDKSQSAQFVKPKRKFKKQKT